MKPRNTPQKVISILFYVIMGIFILSQIVLITGVSRAFLTNEESNSPFILHDLRDAVSIYPADTIFGFITSIDDVVEANDAYRQALNSVIPYLIVESDACCQWIIAHNPDEIDSDYYTIMQSLEDDFFILENLSYAGQDK